MAVVSSMSDFESCQSILSQLFANSKEITLSEKYVRSGDLLHDLHGWVLSKNHSINTNFTQISPKKKLHSLRRAIGDNVSNDGNNQSTMCGSDKWNVLLPQYHSNDGSASPDFQWFRVLRVLQTVQIYHTMGSCTPSLSPHKTPSLAQYTLDNAPQPPITPPAINSGSQSTNIDLVRLFSNKQPLANLRTTPLKPTPSQRQLSMNDNAMDTDVQSQKKKKIHLYSQTPGANASRKTKGRLKSRMEEEPRCELEFIDENSTAAVDATDMDIKSAGLHPLQSELRNRDRIINKLYSELNSKGSIVDRLKRDMEELRKQNFQLTTQNTTLSSNESDMKVSVDTLGGQVSQLTIERTTLKSQVNEWEEKYGTTVHGLYQELQEKKHKLHDVNAELSTKSSRIEQLEARNKFYTERDFANKLDRSSLQKMKWQIKDFRSAQSGIAHDLRSTASVFEESINQIKETLRKMGPSFGMSGSPMMDNNAANAAAEEANDAMEVEIRDLRTTISELNKLYLKEQSHRKQLLEEIIDLKGNIRVFCRVRPAIQRNGVNGNLQLQGIAVTCFDRERLSVQIENSEDRMFEFDQIFDISAGQSVVFEEVSSLIRSCVNGFNVCIFAYGQTGSGKTHTMEGSESQPGVIYRSFDELFELKDEKQQSLYLKRQLDTQQSSSSTANQKTGAFTQITIWLSCLEVYNEKLRDLLRNPNGNSSIETLKVKLDKGGKVTIPGLTRVQIDSTDDVKHYLRNIVHKNRSTGVTNMNQHSSRSHCVVFVDVLVEKKKRYDESEEPQLLESTQSRLVLIDLAGSERVKRSGVTGAALDEAKNINKSLSALGNVFSALQTKQRHIPFRDSQLTYLLHDCLGGDSKALMFCNISSEHTDSRESVNTLQFASRVRSVELGEAKKNSNQMEMLRNKTKQLRHDLEMKCNDLNEAKLELRKTQRESVKLKDSLERSSQSSKQLSDMKHVSRENTNLEKKLKQQSAMITRLKNEISDLKNRQTKRKPTAVVRPKTAHLTTGAAAASKVPRRSKRLINKRSKKSVDTSSDHSPPPPVQSRHTSIIHKSTATSRARQNRQNRRIGKPQSTLMNTTRNIRKRKHAELDTVTESRSMSLGSDEIEQISATTMSELSISKTDEDTDPNCGPPSSKRRRNNDNPPLSDVTNLNPPPPPKVAHPNKRRSILLPPPLTPSDHRFPPPSSTKSRLLQGFNVESIATVQSVRKAVSQNEFREMSGGLPSVMEDENSSANVSGFNTKRSNVASAAASNRNQRRATMAQPITVNALRRNMSQRK